MNGILYTLFQDNTELPGKIYEFCKENPEFCQAEREFEAISRQIAEKLGRELYLDFEDAQSWYMAKLVNAYYLFGLGLRQEVISALQPKVS
ncbi:MAG: hypothetical protein HFF58_03540 [Lawsonibacter sp.]|jgi:hypothetical protein|nr:hypothetical protein [Lawsonibacter sp.]